MTIPTMISTRRPASLNFTAPLVLDPPRHCGLSAIALVPGRHLIGTAAGCGIRLQVDGIVDRHALILVGENRTIVKSMDSRTWVNDSPVSEMALRSGDRLSVGPLTFRVRLATQDEVIAFATTQIEDSTLKEENEVVDEVGQASSQTFPTPPAPEPAPELIEPPVSHAPPAFTEDRDRLDSRLDEIEQRLAELRQSTVAIAPLDEPEPVNVEPDLQSLDLYRQRHEELERRAEQIAAESQRLQERVESVAEREAQVEDRQKQLVLEGERIANVAETARRSLAEEHAQHISVWQEWEGSYQKMMGELTTQWNAIDRQRETLQAESGRLAVSRTESERTRADLERDRQACASELANLANDRIELAELKSQHEEQFRQLQMEADERQAQLEADRRELGRRELELSASREELERERQSLMAEQSAHAARMEQESQQSATLQARLDDERMQLLEQREELRLQAEFQARLEVDRLHVEPISNPPSGTPNVTTTVSGSPQELNDHHVGRISNPPDGTSNVTTTSGGPQQLSEHDVVRISNPPGGTDGLEIRPTVGDEFGVAVDWSALAAVEHEYGRASTYKSAGNDRTHFEPAARNHWGDSSGLGDYGLAASPVNQASTIGLSQTADDPWARFAPAGSEIPESFNLTAESFGDSRKDSDQSLNEHETSLLFNVTADFASHGVTQNNEWPVEADQNLSAHETLAEVNREFGVPIDEPFADQMVADSLPSWWLEKPQGAPEPVAVEHPSWVVEALNSGTPEPRDPAHAIEAISIAAESPANDLRSQLAMLFDLPGTMRTEAAEPDVIENPTEAVEETSNVAPDSIHQGEAPIAQDDAGPVAVTHSEEAEPRVDDSVESFMAKLLARSRTGASESSSPDSKPSTAQAPVSTAATANETVASIPPEQDRSHLMAKPKHTQDRQAVRENLQSFRQVAHLSARSALARHSLRQLRNATIAKGVLLGFATISAGWFLAEPLWGDPLQFWKVSGCSLAALLSALEFGRSWKQLHKPLQGAAPAHAVASPDLPVAELPIDDVHKA